MSQKEYTEYVDSLIAKKLEKDLALIDVTRKWYYEISERQYQFDRGMTHKHGSGKRCLIAHRAKRSCILEGAPQGRVRVVCGRIA